MRRLLPLIVCWLGCTTQPVPHTGDAEPSSESRPASRPVNLSEPATQQLLTDLLEGKLLRDDPPDERWIVEADRKSVVDEMLATGVMPDGTKLQMSETERTYIWDLEHAVLVLKKQGFSKLTGAIATFDGNAIQRLFSPQFQARVPDEPDEIRADGEFGSVTLQDVTGGGSFRKLTATEFVDFLRPYRDLFQEPPKVKFGLKKAKPVARDAMDGLWFVNGKIQLLGHAGANQPAEVILKVRFAVDRPHEERLQEPGWIHGCTVHAVHVGRSNRYLFEEVAVDRGLIVNELYDNWKNPQKVFHTGGVYLLDFNRDGCTDILLNDHALDYHFRLYSGSPAGFFNDVTAQTGLGSLRGNAPVAVADLNNDGWEDIIVGPNQILANRQGQRFERLPQTVDVTADSHVDSITLADFDGDTFIDIYLSRSTVRDHTSGSWLSGDCPDAGNRLIRNKGNWEFEDITDSSGAWGGPRSTFTSVCLDANDDGWPDIYVIHEFGNGILLLNQQDGTFREQLLVPGQTDFGQMGLTCGDLDNNGHIDLYIQQMYSKSGQRIIGNVSEAAYPPEVLTKLRSLVGGSQLYLNSGDMKFQRVGQKLHVNEIGWSWGASLSDFNNDGFLDLYATCGFISRSRDKPDG